MKHLIINKGTYKYKNKFYNEFELSKLTNILGKRASIIILGEALLINRTKLQSKDIDNYLAKYREEYYLNDNDSLFHYEYDKIQKNLIIYSMKGGAYISKIIGGLSYLEVSPIQFKVTEYIIKSFKLNNFVAIFKVKELISLLYIENRMIVGDHLLHNLKAVEKTLIDRGEPLDNVVIDKELFEDNSLNMFNNMCIKKLELGKLYEKLYI